MFGNLGIVFVTESITASGKILALPADSFWIRIHTEEVEGKPISAVAIKPKDTVKVVFEPHPTWEGLFENYHLACPAIINGQSVILDNALIVSVEVVGEPFRAVIQHILPVVQCAVPRLPKAENLWELAFLVRKERHKWVGEVTEGHAKELAKGKNKIFDVHHGYHLFSITEGELAKITPSIAGGGYLFVRNNSKCDMNAGFGGGIYWKGDRIMAAGQLNSFGKNMPHNNLPPIYCVFRFRRAK